MQADLEPATGSSPDAAGVLERASDVASDIAEDGKRILDGYYELAKSDLAAEVEAAKASLALMCLGAVLFGTAGTLLAAALCLALAAFLDVPLWASSCGIGVVTAVIAVVTTSVGRSRMREVEPPEAIADAKEDLKWLAEQT